MRWYHYLLLLLHLLLRVLMLSVRLLLRCPCRQLLQLALQHYLLLQQHTTPQLQALHRVVQLQLLLLDLLLLHLSRGPLEDVFWLSCLSCSRAERASCVLDSAQLSAAGLLLAAVALPAVLTGQHCQCYLI
jgi:hypothetical protein